MKQHCYAIVLTDGDSCWTRVLARPVAYPAEEATWDETNLGRLLQDGWTPVRETPMGGDGGYLASLLLLERNG